MDKLESLESALSTLFGLSRDAVLGIRDAVVVFANPAAEDLFDCALMGRPAGSLLPDYIFEQENDSFVCSAELVCGSVSISVSHAKDLYLISIPREEKPAASVPAGVLSELRSSVYNIKMASDQILAGVPGSTASKVNIYASILYHNYYAMLRMTNNLATVSALSDGSLPFDPVPTDLGLLCSQLVSSVKYLIRDSGVELDFSCAPDNMAACLDREKIEQLILNLISNSLQHTSPEDKITMDLRRCGNKLVLAVDDNGEGIPQEKLPYIFTFYEKASRSAQFSGGAGMGLYIARGIARLHGGALIINSREGSGTSVRVMLPTDDSAADRFQDAKTDYRTDGMKTILTELSNVLGFEAYTPKHFD